MARVQELSVIERLLIVIDCSGPLLTELLKWRVFLQDPFPMTKVSVYRDSNKGCETWLPLHLFKMYSFTKISGRWSQCIFFFFYVEVILACQAQLLENQNILFSPFDYVHLC